MTEPITAPTNRIAFSKPTRDAAEEAMLLEGFRAAGYDGLQLKTSQFVPWVDDADGFRARWTEPGVASALVLFDTLDGGGEERLDRVVDFAIAVGSEQVVYCQNRDRDGIGPAELAGFARILSRFGARAREAGVGFSLHHHYGQPVMLPEDVRVFFDAVVDGAVGLTVDTAHLAKSGVDDIPGFIAEFAPVIENIHLKDCVGGDWRLLGQGDLDLDGILGALREAGYAGWICVDEETATPLADGLRISREWMSAHT